MSFKEGIFPSLNKEASLRPIYKKGDKTKCENYRPISLLSNKSKLFEKVMYARIVEFLKSSDILYKISILIPQAALYKSCVTNPIFV